MSEPVGRELILKGLALSEGCAVARVCMFNEQRHTNLPMYRVDGSGVEREAGRARRAFAIATDRLDEIKVQVGEKIGEAEAGIFVAQKMILADQAMQDKILAIIEQEKTNAETAVTRILDEYENRILELDNEYIKDRASDFGEVKRRVLDVLANMQPSLQCANEKHCQEGKNRIVVAEELTPTLTVDLDTELLMGFVTERGGRNSHGAILARALGIPAVSGVERIRDLVSCGTELLVNGDTGEVVVWPSEESVSKVRVSGPCAVRLLQPVEPVEGFTVMANIRVAGDAEEAAGMKADGIGLYRTEMEVMAAGRLLTEDEHYERYLHVMEAMAGRPVIYRILDIGSDKTLPFLHVPDEDNPALGWRGARLLLGRKDLMRVQTRALARVSVHVEVNVMYPMVVDVDQFMALKTAFQEASEGIPCGSIRHGLMFEVPSACLQADEIFREADFGSVGTNDLTQYLFAVDRDNENVAYDFNPDHPVFWKVLRGLVEASRRNGKELSVCGEIAGDPDYVPKLMEAGIDRVSVSTRRIPAARAAAQHYRPAVPVAP